MPILSDATSVALGGPRGWLRARARRVRALGRLRWTSAATADRSQGGAGVRGRDRWRRDADRGRVTDVARRDDAEPGTVTALA